MYGYYRINSEQFKQSNVDSKGIRYDPLPLTVELYPKDTGNMMMGFMVPPDEVHIKACLSTHTYHIDSNA